MSKSDQQKATRNESIIKAMARHGYENISGSASLNDHAIILFNLPYEHCRGVRLSSNDAVRYYNENCSDMDSLLFRQKELNSEKQATDTENENDAS